MAEPFELTTFDGHSIGPETVYNFMLSEDDDIVVESGITVIERPGAAPLVVNTTSPGRVIIIRSDGPDNDDPATTAYRQHIDQWFDPALNVNGPRSLIRYADDGATLIAIGCYVRERRFTGRATHGYVITLFAPSVAWHKTTITTSASNPATVTNAGNTPTYPTIELTTGTHVTRRVCTVQSASSALPLIAYPVVFALNDAAATSTNTFVYVEGVSVADYVDDSGLVTSRVWALADAVSATVGPATNVDILYGTGITNPLCQTLPDGGLDFDDATNCHNTQWEWNDITVSSNPNRPGAWRPALSGNHNAAADISHQIVTETAAGTTIGIGAAGDYDNSADSLRLTIGATASTLTNFRRTTANLDGVNARAYVRARTIGATPWVDAWTTLANATVTTSISLSVASEVIAGIENFGATADPATVILGSGTNDNRLTITNGPTVVVGAATNYDRYNGVLTIGDRTITFTNFLVPDGTLTIDCENRTITHSVAGPFYGDDEAITFSDPDQWFVLDPGSNAVTNTTGGALTVKHREAFS